PLLQTDEQNRQCQAAERGPTLQRPFVVDEGGRMPRIISGNRAHCVGRLLRSLKILEQARHEVRKYVASQSEARRSRLFDSGHIRVDQNHLNDADHTQQPADADEQANASRALLLDRRRVVSAVGTPSGPFNCHALASQFLSAECYREEMLAQAEALNM